MMYLLFFIYVLLSAGGLVLFKLGSHDLVFSLAKGIFNISFNWYLICGIISYLFSFLLWLYIVTQMKLSLAMPLSLALVNIAVLLGAIFIVGESVTTLQWVGVLVIIIGLIIMNFGL